MAPIADGVVVTPPWRRARRRGAALLIIQYPDPFFGAAFAR